MKTPPPKRALQFLRWFCREDYLEEIEGDLIEIFETQYETSPRRARRKFAWSVIRYFRPEFIKAFRSYNPVNPFVMVRHNLLITYRNFWRYKSSFFINLVGLSTGLAAALLIYLWVYSEMSVDQFHEKKETLFQVLRNIPDASGTLQTHEANSVLLPPALEAEMPEVEYVVPTRPTPADIVSVKERHVRATGWFVGKDFFKAFSYRMIAGNKLQVLQDKHAAVISDELALKLFGTMKNCVGKPIEWFGDTYIISGIYEKNHIRSSSPFDFVVPHEMFLEKNRMDVTWDSNPIMVYVTLEPGADAELFSAKLDAFYKSKRTNALDNSRMFLQRYSDRYLYNHFENGKQAGGRIDYVILFSVIALFILVIACINFMNLSTARASRRLKEVGIKKTIGVLRRALVLQHLGESCIMAFLSLFVAITLAFLLLPQFNLITGKQLILLPEWRLISGVLVIVLITGLVSGSYPAFYLSRFKPVEVLKGKLSATWGESWIRKGLVVFQFSVSLLLIVVVAIIYLQLDFVQSRNLGYKRKNVVSFERQGKLNESLESFLAETRNIPAVINASTVSERVTRINSTSSGHTWEGQLSEDGEVEFSGVNVNYDFFETLGVEIVEGRPFSRDFGSEETSVILNETAIEAMGLADPVGKWIDMFGTRREIIGIAKDFHFQSLYEEINPLFIVCNPKYTHNIIVKIQTGEERQTIAGLENLYKEYNPGFPFEFEFLDTEYHALYAAERRIGQLSKYFALIAVVISCLGLFGLVAFTVERRGKEIGIRKILGCSEFGIIGLLSSDFTKMVVTAILIALPIGYFLTDYWLDNFAYRIDLKWWYFAGAGAAALIIAWFTVGIQTIKAARINPTESLRIE